MENREQQILSEIKSMMASIRSQLERLDAKMAELQQVVDPDGFEPVSVDIDIDMDDIAEAPVSEPVAEPVIELVTEPVVKPVPADVDDDLPFDDDLPGVFDAPEPVTVASKAADNARPTINDMMAEEHAWRRDMPGTPVRDIRSAISLNDRVIFINLLFNEDAQMFVNALTSINSMETLDQVVDFIRAEFPSWDLNSELVYRFMMAVRRKVK